MNTPRLICALLDNSIDFPDGEAAARARDLTISWTRFKYFGPIIEDRSLDGVLPRAAESDADYCLIQAYGHILAEVWHPDGGVCLPVMQAIEDWVDQEEFLVCGHLLAEPGHWYGLKQDCLLIDLRRYRALGRPSVDDPVLAQGDVALDLMAGFRVDGASPRLVPTRERVRIAPRLPGWSLVRLSLEAGHALLELPPAVDAGMVTLDPRDPAHWIGPQPAAAKPAEVEGPQGKQRRFLEGARTLTADLPKSIFVWNLEPYDDIECPAEGFQPPLTTLYSVAAGFKPNRILQTHGFNAETRMLVFDYSPQGLEFRRLLHEEWDGVDYPSFLRVLFRRLPSGEAHYLLWDGMTPENLDGRVVERRWKQELAAWGGEEALYEHWQAFRRIRVEYLLCNLLTEQDKLLQEIHDEQNAIIWWSNAFFSVHSNWLYSSAQRQGIYRRWIEALARKAPWLWIYGSDCHNQSVNCHTARRYLDWLQNLPGEGFDELTPPGLNRCQIRF